MNGRTIEDVLHDGGRELPGLDLEGLVLQRLLGHLRRVPREERPAAARAPGQSDGCSCDRLVNLWNENGGMADSSGLAHLICFPKVLTTHTVVTKTVTNPIRKRL